jgi:Zn finger protein HypA/HybF involved in hydrogenase expression
MVFEGDSLKGYRIDSVNNKVVKIDLPNVEERKQGEWKRKLIDSGYNSVWVCSECQEKIQIEFHDFKFCPYCGADMRC